MKNKVAGTLCIVVCVLLFVLNSEAMQSETASSPSAKKPGPYMIIWFCHAAMSVFWFFPEGQHAAAAATVIVADGGIGVPAPFSRRIVGLSALYMACNWLFVVALGMSRFACEHTVSLPGPAAARAL